MPDAAASVPYVLAQDAIRVNAFDIPVTVLAAGYTTGSGAIPWGIAQWAAHLLPYPAVRIDQDPSASDKTADVLDVESGAATISDIVPWVRAARANFSNNVRPGQRWPAVYLSMGNLDAAIAALQAAGITGVGFWTAQPGMGLSAAVTRVQTATGSYPCIGVQYAWGNVVDYDVFSESWVTTVSGGGAPVEPTISEGSLLAAAVVLLRERLDFYNAGLSQMADGSASAFGTTVLAAVKAFQGVNGLTQDGIVGPLTWGKLLATDSKPVPGTTPPPLPPPTPLPPKPIPAPGNMSQAAHPVVDFSWGTPAGAGINATYHFQVTHLAASALVVDKQVQGNHVLGLGLAPGQYQWRVSVSGAQGLWSAWHAFSA